MIDEAGSRIRIKNTESPSEIKDLELEINELSLKKDSAINEQDFELAASIRDEQREKLEK